MSKMIKMNAGKIVRPGVTRLEHLFRIVRERAQIGTYSRVEPLLTKEVRAFLDCVLEPEKR